MPRCSGTGAQVRPEQAPRSLRNPQLTVFLEDAYVPLDNNRTGRALRGLVIGRKNHYGSRSQRGTEVAALFYSLIETAILNGVDPADYIYTAAIFAIEHGEALLPWEFAALPDAT